jgi:hypothetical protein
MSEAPALDGPRRPAAARATDSGWRKRLTLALCFLAILCEGIDIVSMGLAAPRMAPALGLTRDQLGPLFSASIVGLLVGAVIFGRLADRFGRKWTLVTCLVIFGFFSLATAAVRPFEALLAVRLAAGLGLGGALPNLVALAAEAVAPQSRAGLVTRITDRGGQSGLAGHLLCRRAGAPGAGPDRRLRPPRVTGLSRGAPVGAADGGGAR